MCMIVEIYTKPFCSHSERARELLRIKGVPFAEYVVTGDPARVTELRQRGGSGTLPAIFVAGRLVGGCDELFALDERGALDPLITPSF